jgi:hypothetical protein
MMHPEQIDHVEYPKRLVRMASSTLHRIISDCKAAIQAWPDGQKAGYYADEISYCCMELNKRKP